MPTAASFVNLDIVIGQVENLNPQGQAESGINTGVTLNTADTGITLNSGGVIKGGQTAFNTGNGFFLGYSGSQYKVSIGDPSGDNLTWDGADLTITADTGTISGDLTVNGNFTVNGTTTTLNTATLDVEDKNITLNYGSGDTSSTANGAGITIQDAVNSTTDASILWNGTTDAFDFSNSINFGDNDKALFGAGSDLQLYHSGSHSYIIDNGTGDLKIYGANIEIGNTSGVKNLFATSGGATALYFNNGSKLATTNTGIDVTGTATMDGLTVDGTIDSDGTFNPGTSNWTTASFKGTGSYGGGIAFVDGTAGFANYVLSSGATYRIGQGSTSGGLTTHFQISNSGDISFYDSAGTSQSLFWDSSAEALGIGTSSPAQTLHVNSGNNNDVALFESSDSVAKITFKDNTSSSAINTNNGNMVLNCDLNDEVADSFMAFRVDNDEKMRIEDTGRVGIGTNSPEELLHLTDTGGNAVLKFTRNDTTTTSGGTVGAIQFAHKDADDPGVAASIVGKATNAFGKVALTFATGNPTTKTEHMRLDAEGNLGIGTSSPSFPLEVNGGTGDGIKIKAGNTSNDDSFLIANSSNATMFLVDGSGNVGINTDSPTDTLSVGTLGSGSNSIITIGASTTGTSSIYFGDGASAARFRGYFDYVHSSDSLAIGTAGTERMRITSGGILEFNNDAVISVNDTADSMYIGGGGTVPNTIQNQASALHNWQMGGSNAMRMDSSGTLLVGKTSQATATIGAELGNSGYVSGSRDGNTAGFFNRATSDGEIIRITKDGATVGSIGVRANYIKIGNGDTHLLFNSASDAVTPEGASDNRDAAIDLGRSVSRFKDLYLSGNVTHGTTPSSSAAGVFTEAAGRTTYSRGSGTGGFSHLKFTNGNGTVGTVTTSNSATAYNTSSDQRLKDNIVDAPSASDDIDAIQVRSFDWKADGSHQKYGMVAQELSTVAPEAVSEGETEEDMMGVDYSKLVPMMLKEIQSLRARVAQLEGEN